MYNKLGIISHNFDQMHNKLGIIYVNSDQVYHKLVWSHTYNRLDIISENFDPMYLARPYNFRKVRAYVHQARYNQSDQQSCLERLLGNQKIRKNRFMTGFCLIPNSRLAAAGDVCYQTPLAFVKVQVIPKYTLALCIKTPSISLRGPASQGFSSSFSTTWLLKAARGQS